VGPLDAGTDRFELNLKSYYVRELRSSCQQSMAEAPGNRRPLSRRVGEVNFWEMVPNGQRVCRVSSAPTVVCRPAKDDHSTYRIALSCDLLRALLDHRLQRRVQRETAREIPLRGRSISLTEVR